MAAEERSSQPGLIRRGFPALPTESIIYKILLGARGSNIQKEVRMALTPDTYMTVAEGKLIQIMSTEATKWNGIKAMLEAAGVERNCQGDQGAER